jgi:hypothetical protein
MLIFLHMPKTAGHSFKHAVIARYGDNRIAYLNEPDEFAGFLAEYKPKRWGCVHGHIPWGIHARLAEPCTYYVVLRDPIDRFISSYYHIVRTPAHFYHRVVAEHATTLRDYANFTRDRQTFDFNTQVQRLCRDFDFDTQTQQLCREAARHGRQGWFPVPPKTEGAVPNWPERLEHAKQTLEGHVTRFGLFEHFEESFEDFCDLLGVTVGTIPRENVAASRPGPTELDPETVQAIRGAVSYEYELYEHARALWRARAEERLEHRTARARAQRRLLRRLSPRRVVRTLWALVKKPT